MTVSFGTNWPNLTVSMQFNGSTWTDITSYCRSININRPSSDETGRFAAGTCTIVLDNRDGRFSPANTSGPYSSGGVTQVVPEVPLRIQCDYNGNFYAIFVGQAEDWADEFPAFGRDAVTVLTATDPMARIAAWSGSPVTLVGDGENTGARVDRILDAAGYTGNVIADTGDSTVQATDLSGNGMDQVYASVDAEGGFFWFEPFVLDGPKVGEFYFVKRSGPLERTRSKNIQATFSDTGASTLRFRDLVTSSGRALIVRSAAFTRTDGAEQVSGSGTPRITKTGLGNMTDPQVAALAEFAVAKGNPTAAYRVKQLTIDPIRDPTIAWPVALGTMMLDRVKVDVTISASSLRLVQELFIDGISHTITPQQWSTTFSFASTSAWAGFSASQWDTGVWDTAKWFY